VNFATGANHLGGPQINDNQCANCHTTEGELPFDASITGAHTVPSESSLLTGLAVKIKQITATIERQKPTVTFTVQDGSGKALPLSSLGSLSFTMAGPASDYGYTSFGNDVTTPGYVTESALASACDSSGTCTYGFKHAVPEKAIGTYAIGVEARRTETLLPGTVTEMNVTYGTRNQVMYFAVDGKAVAARRTVVAIDNCNRCHVALSVHGSLRNQTEYCVLCHNPSNTDAATRSMAQDPRTRQRASPGHRVPLDGASHPHRSEHDPGWRLVHGRGFWRQPQRLFDGPVRPDESTRFSRRYTELRDLPCRRFGGQSPGGIEQRGESAGLDQSGGGYRDCLLGLPRGQGCGIAFPVDDDIARRELHGLP
jgi:OmcA/MtrC family decaheme c-type cytochrome